MTDSSTTTTTGKTPCTGRCGSARAAARAVPPGGSGGRRRGWLRAATVVPAAVLPLLPSFTCPACLAAYAGVLSAMGLGFLLNEAFLAPVIAVVLVASVAGVAWSTPSHRRPGPLVATTAGALAIVAGRLVWDLPVVLYAGIAVLLAGSLWNLWLKRPRRARLVQSEMRRQDPVGVPVESRS